MQVGAIGRAWPVGAHPTLVPGQSSPLYTTPAPPQTQVVQDLVMGTLGKSSREYPSGRSKHVRGC